MAKWASLNEWVEMVQTFAEVGTPDPNSTHIVMQSGLICQTAHCWPTLWSR